MSRLELNLASRSWSNEAEGAGMYASLSRDGVILAYFPDEQSIDAVFALMKDGEHFPAEDNIENQQDGRRTV